MEILTSIMVSSVVAAAVSGIFQLIGQMAERKARRQQLLFTTALAISDKDIETQEKTNERFIVPDRIDHARKRYEELESLYDKGELPKKAIGTDSTPSIADDKSKHSTEDG